MFPNRPPVPTGATSSFKNPLLETCDRIKEEFNFVQQQYHSLQVDREKLLGERTDMQKICVMYYEMANGLNLEMHRQMEIAKRLNAILNQVVPFLSQEHQAQVASAIERAKQVSMQELNSVLSAQMEDSKLNKFSNGNTSNMPHEQLDSFKQFPTPGSSSSQNNLLSNSGNSQISNVLNGLMSAAVAAGSANTGAANFMMPPPGRDGDEKQRAAALAALFFQNAASGPNISGVVPPASSSSPRGAAGTSRLFPPPLPPTSTTPGSSRGPECVSPGGSSVSSNNSLFTNMMDAATIAAAAAAVANADGPGTQKKRRFMPPASSPSQESSAKENGNWRLNDDANHDKIPTPNSLPDSGRRSGGSYTSQRSDLSPQAGYPTTASAPAPSSHRASDGHRSKHHHKSPSTSGPGAFSLELGHDGQMRPSLLAAAPTATLAPGLPRRLQYIASLPHGEVVCAVTLGPAPVGRSASLNSTGDEQPPDNLDVATNANGCSVSDSELNSGVSPSAHSPPTPVRPSSVVSCNGYFAYTGGRGCVKLWDLNSVYQSSVNGGVSNSSFIGNNGPTSPFSSTSSLKQESNTPLVTFDCLYKDAYVRSIKLMPDASGLVIGGESNSLTVWDLNGPGRRKTDLPFDTLACYALALSPDGKLCYSCYSDGDVAVWDWHNQCVVTKFSAHTDGASCVEIMPCGNRLWTGGLDLNVRCWDLRSLQAEELHRVPFKSQVFTLGVWKPPKIHNNSLRSNGIHENDAASPTTLEESNRKEMERCVVDQDENLNEISTKRPPRFAETSDYWLAVGLESSEVEVMAVGADGPARPAPLMPPSAFLPPPISAPVIEEFNIPQPIPQHFRLTRHESCVLALKFAHKADWFITTGKDHQVNAWRAPFGTCLLETKEAASVLTCDISHDDKFVVTGSGDKKANLYEVVYASPL